MLNKQNQDTEFMLQNKRNIIIGQLTKLLQYIKNLTPQLPRADESDNIPEEEMNEVLLHSVPHGWSE